MANPTGIETAVAPPAEDAMLAYGNRATPRDWQSFVRRVLDLESRVKTLEEQLSQIKP